MKYRTKIRHDEVNELEDWYTHEQALIEHAELLGYKVCFTSSRPNATNFKNKLIYIPQHTDFDSVYALVHEIGHCLDYKNNKFDIQKYKTNKPYRLWKEFLGWWYGLGVCRLHQIPVKNYPKYALKMWLTYLKQK